MAKRPPDPADPAAVTADPITADPVTTGDIAEFLTRLARQRSPALGGDPADRAELLSDKADLFARIADQHARTDPALAEQARDIAGHTRAAATSPATRPGRRTTRHREPRQDRDQPLHAEVDHGSTSAKAQPPDRSWLVRLRRDNRAVIIVTGLARPSAEHLASKINTLLCPLDTPARHAEDTDTHDTTNVNDLASPSSPRQGISLSDTAEFRRASSMCRLTSTRTRIGRVVGMQSKPRYSAGIGLRVRTVRWPPDADRGPSAQHRPRRYVRPLGARPVSATELAPALRVLRHALVLHHGTPAQVNPPEPETHTGDPGGRAGSAAGNVRASVSGRRIAPCAPAPPLPSVAR